MEFVRMSKYDVWLYGAQRHKKKKNQNVIKIHFLDSDYNTHTSYNRCVTVDKCSVIILFL